MNNLMQYTERKRQAAKAILKHQRELHYSQIHKGRLGSTLPNAPFANVMMQYQQQQQQQEAERQQEQHLYELYTNSVTFDPPRPEFPNVLPSFSVPIRVSSALPPQAQTTLALPPPSAQERWDASWLRKDVSFCMKGFEDGLDASRAAKTFLETGAPPPSHAFR